MKPLGKLQSMCCSETLEFTLFDRLSVTVLTTFFCNRSFLRTKYPLSRIKKIDAAIISNIYMNFFILLSYLFLYKNKK